jgi:hypothetical protein
MTDTILNISPRDFEVCLYHHHCPDGIGAAWCFWRENLTRPEPEDENQNKSPSRRQKKTLRDGCIIQGVTFTDPLPLELVRGKNVVIMDFCFERYETIALCSAAKNVMVLDHHDTALRNLDGLHQEVSNLGYIFDMNRSGAQIAWDWYHPKTPEPWFISYIADRDLWKWELPNSREIGKSLYCNRWYTFDKMEELFNLSDAHTEEYKKKFAVEGAVLIGIEEKDISYAVHKSVLCEFLGYRVRLTTCSPTIRSEVGSSICAKGDCDFAVVWRYDFESDQWWMNLRGDKDCEIHLNVLCEKYGGGGHIKASGFAIHGNNSKEWINSSSEKRSKMAHGNLHDYFVMIKE